MIKLTETREIKPYSGCIYGLSEEVGPAGGKVIGEPEGREITRAACFCSTFLSNAPAFHDRNR
jgi:hypothetical protein